MRFLVLIAILVCFVSLAKVALMRYKKNVSPAAAAKVWEADGRLRAYPTAEISPWRNNLVYSPYVANTLLDTAGYLPGDLMRCGASKQPFYVPFNKELQYGEIVGDWRIQRFDRQGPVEYQVRFVADIHGVIGRGRRIITHGRVLPESQQSPISCDGRFVGNRLLCQFREDRGGAPFETGSFDWTYSSTDDTLTGLVRADFGIMDSKARRITGSRGSIPASGKEAKHFVPAGWVLLDSVRGRLSSTGGEFLVMAVEESGASPFRWLVMAQRDRAVGDFQTMLVSPSACRRHLGQGKGDPLDGLFLPQDQNRAGIFGLRHHVSRDYQHVGIDLWFHYDSSSKDWRLAEGRRYQLDLDQSESLVSTLHVLPGTSLSAFDIDAIQFDMSASERLAVPEITATP